MPPETSLLPLTQGLFATVSAHRFAELSGFKWSALWNPCTKSHYAVRTDTGSDGSVYLHRQILGLEAGNPLQADHRNHDTLDNTDANLRTATRSQQQANSRLKCNYRSGYKGVYESKRGDFLAQVYSGGRKILLGRHRTVEAAAEAYNAAASELWGEFACLNFIPAQMLQAAAA